MIIQSKIKAERIRITEIDPTAGQLTGQATGKSKAGGFRVLNGWILDAHPGEVWAIEYEVEPLGEDAEMLWIVDAQCDTAAQASRRAGVVQLELAIAA
jgi:hypothetical protein